MTICSAAQLRYTAPVTSKKGVMGFGRLDHRCDASRSSFADSAASLFASPVLVTRWEARKGLPVRASGGRSSNPSSHRPHLDVGAVVFANHTAWRPIMATSPVCAHACAPSPFRSDLPPDELAAISDLARSLRADVEEPFRALSVLHELLSKMDLEGTVPVWGLVSLMAPALSQLDELRGTVSTLAHRLGHEVLP